MIRPWLFVGVLIGTVVMVLELPNIPRSMPVERWAAAIFYPTAGLLFSIALHAGLGGERSPGDSG